MKLIVALLIVSCAVLLTLHLIRNDAFYSIQAATEYMTVTLRGNRASETADLRWRVTNDSLLVDGLPMEFSGLIAPGARARITVARAGTGPLQVGIEADSGGVAAILIEGDDPVATARETLYLQGRPDSLRNYTLPYVGDARIGDVVSSGGRLLLIDGSVLVLGSTVLGGDRFEAGTIGLRMGDQVRIAGANACEDGAPGATGFGVIRAGMTPGLTVVHEARGDALRITRAGAQPHCFRPALWSFVAADPILGGIILFAAAVLLAVTQSLVTYLLIENPTLVPTRLRRVRRLFRPRQHGVPTR